MGLILFPFYSFFQGEKCQAGLDVNQFVGRYVYVICERTSRRFIFTSDKARSLTLFAVCSSPRCIYLSTYLSVIVYSNSVLALPEFVYQCVCMPL